MTNAQMTIEKDILIIKIDLSKPGTISKSKKSETIASTQGNIAVGTNGMHIGLNVYKARELTPKVVKEIEEVAEIAKLKKAA